MPIDRCCNRDDCLGSHGSLTEIESHDNTVIELEVIGEDQSGRRGGVSNANTEEIVVHRPFWLAAINANIHSFEDENETWLANPSPFMSAEKEAPVRPAPRFYEPGSAFSTKKARTPRDNPPKPPAKSCPPQSRVFSQKHLDKAELVSFCKDPKIIAQNISSFLCPLYNDDKPETYLEQRFVQEKRLGAGSFGEVYKVKCKVDGKFYAVKRSCDPYKGEWDRRRKHEEVAKLELLANHPNCVRFIRAWEERRHLYIQTDLYDTSLNDFAETNHEIPERLIWNYLVDLLKAVNHIHSHDLIHMDIKPENIFLASDGTCKLGDYGLVVEASKGNGDDTEGDPKYLAPEVLEGKFTKAADIFSLGITIFELASDIDLPKSGECWHKLRHGELPEEFMAGRISNELKSVIKLMMEPDCMRRPSAVQLLEMPCIRKRVIRRRWEYFVRQRALAFVGVFLLLWSFFVSLWSIVKKPLVRNDAALASPPRKLSRMNTDNDGNSEPPPPSSDSRAVHDISSDVDDDIGLLSSAVCRPDGGASPSMHTAREAAFSTTTGRGGAGSSPLAAAGSVARQSARRSAARRRLGVDAIASLPVDHDEEIKTSLEPRNLLGVFESVFDGAD